MSGLILNDTLIDAADLTSVDITVDRIDRINSGVRIWFVLLSTDGKYFQRWSLLMNPIDEILMLAQPGDKLCIKYLEDTVTDPISKLFEPFNRNVIFDVSVI